MTPVVEHARGRSLEALAILRKRNAEPLAIGGGLLVGELTQRWTVD
jgi:hypothetical protein